MSAHSVAAHELEQGLLSGTRKPSPSFVTTRWRKMAAGFVVLIVGIWILMWSWSAVAFKPITPVFPIPEKEQLNWGQYSPYFPVAEYEPPPDNCKITQVNILQRHGARFPTSGATTSILAALSKLQSVEEYKDSALDFLKTFKYDLGQNDLVKYGAQESFDAGQHAFERYRELISQDNLPFVRSDSSERVVLSATNWTAGFSSASKGTFNPVLSVILSEAGNDTLDDAMCPAAPSSSPQTTIWLNTFAPPIAARLNTAAPGANLTNADISSLISLCPFETVAKEQKSAFCTLFEGIPGSFEGFAYSGDLDKFYGTGYGNPLGRVQGVGYVNELLARLTQTPVRDHTQTNRTLDGAPATFPLDRTLYADFSHDNQMAAIYAALGLFRQAAPLDPARPDPRRTWRASALVPFAGRMVVERLACVAAGAQVPKVRVLVQDEVQPLEFCGANIDKLCTLDAFVQSQGYARNDGEGDFEKCFADGA